MSKQREALDALEGIHPGNMTPMAEQAWNKAINAIREALAEREQEPVAWLSIDSIGEHYLYFSKPLDNDPAFPLYLAPTALTEPLTDEEIMKTAKETQSAEPGRDGYILPFAFARAIERAHGITE